LQIIVTANVPLELAIKTDIRKYIANMVDKFYDGE
jgi:hypothetical protein